MRSTANILYGVNVGRLSVKQRNRFLERGGATAGFEEVNSEQYNELREVAIAEELTLLRSFIPSRISSTYALSQLHVGRWIGRVNDRDRPKSQGPVETAPEEMTVCDIDEIAKLRKDPSELLEELGELGLRVKATDLALYVGGKDDFSSEKANDHCVECRARNS